MSVPLNQWLLRTAYSQGIFPMADDDGIIRWYAPHRRALFPIEGIRLSRSLARTIRSGKFEIRFDTAFEQVMRSCMRPEENWINEELIRAFVRAHHDGWAHCCECWLDGELAGGIYGVALGTCFSAESMFHRVRDASKVALWAMVVRCRECGFEIFDVQIQNPHLESLGAFEIPQEEYVRRLQESIHRKPSRALSDQE